ncbi:putative hydro-lyase [Cupriavidus pauculus]|uniref:Putative hydro-lyase CYJ10_29905 n=1 Tax=Cupriavidus pauculus TaxID=82633 RepID=A0A2N5C3P7_9BURK|nr:putative hydro-lyase [Cupriavidus pauculus]PLP96810.1 putative hydro-lyase [Cupriavidus pauculus]
MKSATGAFSAPMDDPAIARAAIRRGDWRGHTAGMAPGRVQGNLMILPLQWAPEFLAYCRANPVPCPLIGMTEPGSPLMPRLGRDIDLRTDLPRYRVWRNGTLSEECEDITTLWRNDFVGFVLGCSLSFEHALQRSGIEVRHVDEGKVVPMYRTNIETTPVSPFSGTMVVSMRPYVPEIARQAAQICAQLPAAHGAPVHIGDPSTIGIVDVNSPDEGDTTDILPGEVPVFWGCGVTPQVAAMNARLPICITHAPGYMLIGDLEIERVTLL